MSIFLEVDGQAVPLQDCSWYSYSPCGCCSGVMMAESGDDVYATEEQAWAHFEPNTALRKRDQSRGLRLEIGLRREVQAKLVMDCPHDPKWGHAPAAVLDGFVWATTEIYPSARDRAHLVPRDVATAYVPRHDFPLARPGKSLCGRDEYRWWTSGRVLADAVECARCVRAAQKAVT